MAQRTTRAVEFERLAALETDDHVLWPYAKITEGYGHFRVNRVAYYVHRLALSRRESMPPERTFVCHQPGCPRHCLNYRHLRWGSHSDNMNDMVSEGHSTRGVRQNHNVLTEADVRDIRVLRATTTFTYKEIAAMYDVGVMTVAHIVKRRTWGWLE